MQRTSIMPERVLAGSGTKFSTFRLAIPANPEAGDKRAIGSYPTVANTLQGTSYLLVLAICYKLTFACPPGPNVQTRDKRQTLADFHTFIKSRHVWTGDAFRFKTLLSEREAY